MMMETFRFGSVRCDRFYRSLQPIYNILQSQPRAALIAQLSVCITTPPPHTRLLWLAALFAQTAVQGADSVSMRSALFILWAAILAVPGCLGDAGRWMAACEEKRVRDNMGVRGEHGERPEQVTAGTYRAICCQLGGHYTCGGSVRRGHFLARSTAFNAIYNLCYKVIRGREGQYTRPPYTNRIIIMSVYIETYRGKQHFSCNQKC